MQQTQPQTIPQAAPQSQIIDSAALLALSSAASIGANFAQVRKGEMTSSLAVSNGLAKGVAATLILASPPTTAAQTLFCAGALAASAYTIDTLMKFPIKKGSDTPDRPPKIQHQESEAAR